MNYCKEWLRLGPDVTGKIVKHHISFPVKIGEIAKEFGLLVKRATLKPGISGEIRESSGQYVIKVNRHDSEERQRFTLAHEIAHFLLHKDKIGDGIVDTMLFRSSLSDKLEAEANRLAADLVIPFSLIYKEDLSDFGRIEEQIEYLSRLSKISAPALEIRMGKKGF